MRHPPSGGSATALALATLCALPAAAVAQRTDESLLTREVPTVSGASRYDQSTAEAPASVTLITADEIERFGYRTLGEILDNVRGLQISSDRNYGSLGVRGFTRSGDYNSRMLVLIDGRRVNDNIYDDSGLGEDGPIDVAMIDRVEIIRGPSSALYGPNAIFGVINIHTRRGRDLDGARIDLGAGTRRSGEARLTWGRRYDTDVEVLVSAASRGTLGERSLYFSAFDTPANGNGIARDADGEHARNLFGKLRIGRFTLSAGWSERDKRVPTAAFGTRFGDTAFRTNDERSHVQLQYEGALSTETEFQWRISHSSARYDGQYPYGAPRNVLNIDGAHGTAWNVDALLSTRLSSSQRLVFGGEFQLNTRVEQTNRDTTQWLDDRHRSIRRGLYAQHEWRLDRKWLLNTGARLDGLPSGGSVISPRLGLIHFPRLGTALKLLVGDAYRAPNAYELYYNDGNSTQRANPELRRETASTREVVIEHQLDARWTALASFYSYRLDNHIRQVTEAGTGLLVFRNLSSVQSTGQEFEIHGSTRRGATLRASLALQAGRDNLNGLPLPGMPRTLAKAQFGLPLEPGRSSLGLSARYMAPRDTLAQGRLPSTLVADLAWRRTLRTERAVLVVGVRNLLDRRYSDPGAREHTQDSIPQDRRSAWVRLELSF